MKTTGSGDELEFNFILVETRETIINGRRQKRLTLIADSSETELGGAKLSLFVSPEMSQRMEKALASLDAGRHFIIKMCNTPSI